MTPQAFIAHWQNNNITERAGAQQHFNDLCEVLGMEKPRDAENYTFERGAKIIGGQGWADVWKRGCFAWEYKAPNKDLNAALKQLMNYALALDNPPLLVVSDLRTIEVHTHFTGHPSEVHRIEISQLTQPENLQKLRWLFQEPERFKPQRTTYAVTEQAANRIGEIAERLNQRGNAPQDVAHFLIQCVFCMFAEDAKLLPEKLFETVLDKSNPDGSKAQKRLSELFNAMQGGGDFAMNDIPWFNGGLFKTIHVPVLETVDVINLLDAARMDWTQIEPAILGTLFERGLNPDMRSQLGAHYTDPATIMKIIRPVVEQPLLAEWQIVKAKIEKLSPKMKLIGTAKSNYPNKEMLEGYQLFRDFLTRLRGYKVLDPACGSGNFLYLALKTLKDLEHRVNIEVEALGLHRELNIETSPANVLGIELNPYAAELARVTVWIGEIQWMLSHGYQYRKNPILASLDHIECRDAIMNDEGTEAEWPECDALVGNPPFLGSRKLLTELGKKYTDSIRKIYKNRVPNSADLVCFWFERARQELLKNKLFRFGFVATQSIRKGKSNNVIKSLLKIATIYDAWPDEEWINQGAAVRVSMISMRLRELPISTICLSGEIINSEIFSDLTITQKANILKISSNLGLAYQGIIALGPFDISGNLARTWLTQPNPNNQPNSDVLFQKMNARDLSNRYSDKWIIAFDPNSSDLDSSLYEKPWAYAQEKIKPARKCTKKEGEVQPWDIEQEKYWWRHWNPRQELRSKISSISKYIATPRVAKHRFFVWLDKKVLPDTRLFAICSDKDFVFGILSSRIHEIWSLANASRHGVGNDPTYNSESCFETFPFPECLTPKDTQGSHSHGDAITTAAQRLNELRENWLNPLEWVDWVITPEEEKAGYPKRVVAKAGFEVELKKRTLTNLYNQRPTWLDNAHKTLDAAVAQAYGWKDYSPDMPDEEILRLLLELNLRRYETTIQA